jgi:hypothetical protein
MPSLLRQMTSPQSTKKEKVASSFSRWDEIPPDKKMTRQSPRPPQRRSAGDPKPCDSPRPPRRTSLSTNCSPIRRGSNLDKKLRESDASSSPSVLDAAVHTRQQKKKIYSGLDHLDSSFHVLTTTIPKPPIWGMTTSWASISSDDSSSTADQPQQPDTADKQKMSDQQLERILEHALRHCSTWDREEGPTSFETVHEQ